MLTDDIYNMIVDKDLKTAEIKSEGDMRMIAELKLKGIKRLHLQQKDLIRLCRVFNMFKVSRCTYILVV